MQKRAQKTLVNTFNLTVLTDLPKKKYEDVAETMQMGVSIECEQAQRQLMA